MAFFAGTVAAQTPPTVSLTAPAAGSSRAVGTAVSVTANAADSDGSVVRVRFLANGVLIAADTSAPYGVTWTPTITGTYSLVAVAIDDDTLRTRSAPRSVTITGSNTPPTVSLTAPANGATFTAPATINLTANASDANGTVAKVDFYSGLSLIGSDTVAPYAATWSNAPAGSYTLTAIATDNGGATTNSAARSVTVNSSSNTPPTVSLAAPAGAPFTAPATIVLNATASDANGTVAKVDFFSGLSLIGSDTASPYTATWSNAPAGSYNLTAIATDNQGATASSSRAVTVNAASGLPPGWTSQDIGSPASAGSASFSGGSFTVSGGGNIWDASDQFHFVHQQATGDVDVVARMASVQNVDAWSRGGVMIRESLAGGSANVTMMITVGQGFTFQRRVATNGTTVSTLSAGQAPGWVKLTRRGNTLTAFRSADGTTWTTAGTQTLTLPATVYLGLVMTSDASTAATSVLDSVAVVSAGGNTPPAVSLTAPVNGTTYTAPATINLAASASDSDGTVSKVDFFNGSTLIASDATSPYSFAWSNVSVGTYTLTAVATDNAAATTTSASRTVTVGSPSNTPPTVSLTAPANGTTYTAPATIALTANASDANGTVTMVEFLRNGILIGSDASSPYSVTWSNVAAGTYALTARATDNAGATTTSTASTVTVGTTSNTPPTASLTAPANGATFTAPATIALTASASDANGTVTMVEFLRNGILIGSDASSPYSFTWSNVAAGTYTLTARATDNAGATTTSASRTVTVSGANQSPTVTLTAPIQPVGGPPTFTAPATIRIDANAGDADGTVSLVEFFSNSSLIGTDSAAAYTFTWNNVPAGNYALTARARDNNGAMTVSGTIDVVVNAAGTPGRAVFVPSSNHNTAVDNYVLEIFPAGADPTAANPVASQNLGKPAVVAGECEANVLQTISNLPPGNYIATVTAFGPGGSAQSLASAQFSR